MPIETSPFHSISENNIVAKAEQAYELFGKIKEEVNTVIFGQDETIENAIISILAGGHILLVGAPGLAKTRLVSVIAQVLGLEQKRIQFTPDLMPSDILGSEILEENEGQKSFRYLKGPIFTQLLMADEINRASTRTQAALLQAMQEYYVTVAGQAYHLPQPFHVIATQNPFEHEGTYPLPEAQLDRFLMQILIDYPDFETEKRILIETTKQQNNNIMSLCDPHKLQEIQTLVRHIPLPENIISAILNLVRMARPNAENDLAQNYILFGPGPRATQAFGLCVRARALYHGRFMPTLEDIKALAKPILRHRIALNFNAKAEAIHTDDFIEQIMKKSFSCL